MTATATVVEQRILKSAREFRQFLKLWRFWELPPGNAFMGELADYDDELPALLRRVSHELYDALEDDLAQPLPTPPSASQDGER
jgi:hypothetical protein